MRVKNFMKKVATIAPTANVAMAARKMLECDINCLPVIDASGRMVGIVTEGDLFRHVSNSRLSMLYPDKGQRSTESNVLAMQNVWPVHSMMSVNVVTTGPDNEAREIAATMLLRKIKNMPVVDHGTLLGIVSRSELLGEIIDAPRNIADCGTTVETLPLDETADLALKDPHSTTAA